MTNLWKEEVICGPPVIKLVVFPPSRSKRIVARLRSPHFLLAISSASLLMAATKEDVAKWLLTNHYILTALEFQQVCLVGVHVRSNVLRSPLSRNCWKKAPKHQSFTNILEVKRTSRRNRGMTFGAVRLRLSNCYRVVLNSMDRSSRGE